MPKDTTGWIKLRPGIRYRKHLKRKHGVKYDRYYTIFYKLDGKMVEESLGWASKGMTEKKVVATLAELQENQRRGTGPRTLKEKRKMENDRREAEKQAEILQEKESITFGQFFQEKYLPIASSTKKAKTIEVEEGYFRTWIEPEIGDKPFKDLFPLQLEKIKANMLKAGRAPRSVQLCMAIIRQVWNQARRDGLTDRDCPTREIKLPKIDNKRMRFLTHDEADRLLENLAGRSNQLHDIALLSLHTGMRAGEIFSLKWGDMDLEQGLISVVDAKAGSRTAYMTDEVKEMLKRRKHGNQSPKTLVFRNAKGKKIDKISFSYVRAVNKLGLNNGVTDHRQKVLFHTLRHTYASWLVQQGEPLYTVQKLMGHATIAMTERYSHLAPDTLKTAVKNFEKNLNGKKSKKKKVVNMKEK